MTIEQSAISENFSEDSEFISMHNGKLCAITRDMKTVLVTGASGLIGQHLCKLLETKGYNIHVLGRTKKSHVPYKQFVWDIRNDTIEEGAFNGVSAIIHLAGANISEGRWTNARKQEIRDSRIKSIKLLLKSIKKASIPLDCFISASAIGYYGAVTEETIFEESDNPAGDFISNVCLEWELAANAFEQAGIRTVKLRTGVVFTPTGGPLAKMAQPVKLGVGSALGRGDQYMPWIHIDDLCAMYVQSLEKEDMKGPFNAVAPEHATNKAVTKAIGAALNKKVWFPNIPGSLLKIIFGEMAVIFLEGSRISSDRIQETGFKFAYPNLKKALQDLL